ncbi:hypothetical protein JCM11641_006438 [Rhodosporidiobolus odoratus]
MVPDIVRDSVFGQTINYLSKGRIFPYPEQRSDYQVPAHYLARTSSNEVRDSRSSDRTLNDASGRQSVDAGQIAQSSNGKKLERSYMTDQEKHDRRLNDGVKREGQGGPDLESGPGEEELNEEEKNRRKEEWKKNHPGTADPERAHADGLHDKYQYLVDWEENDPANPQNWSTPKRTFVAIQISVLTAVVYIGSAIYTPSEQGLMAEYGVSQTVTVLGLTLFILGYGIGPSAFPSLPGFDL